MVYSKISLTLASLINRPKSRTSQAGPIEETNVDQSEATGVAEARPTSRSSRVSRAPTGQETQKPQKPETQVGKFEEKSNVFDRKNKKIWRLKFSIDFFITSL